MRFRPLVAGVAVGCAAAAALASAASCGGTTAATGSDAAADGTTAHDGAPGTGADVGPGSDGGSDSPFSCGFGCEDAQAPLTACPPTPPAAKSPCSEPGEVCEYGSSWWMQCNVVLQCVQGAWYQQSDGTGCPWLDGGGACPATWDEARSIDASPPFCPFASCVYPEGFCGCGVACGGGGAPRPADLTGIFVCIPSTAACPEPRPLSGTSCDSDASCSYGWGCGCGQYEQCTGGVWQAQRTPPCP